MGVGIIYFYGSFGLMRGLVVLGFGGFCSGFVELGLRVCVDWWCWCVLVVCCDAV